MPASRRRGSTPLPWYAELTGGVYEAIAVDSDHPLDLGSTGTTTSRSWGTSRIKST